MSREAAAMSTSQSIQGLIKWSQRGEWRDNFEAALERHVGPACRSAGIGLDELAEIIGDHWMSTLWGCVFEDLVSAGRAERNVADDYLKRRGWKESAGTRAYIEALRRSSMSLYEVSDIVSGVSFLARDLVRGGEPVRVFERSATRSLSQWDRIAARVVTVLGKTQITGSVLPFSHQLAEEALASIERVRKKVRAEAVKLARSLGRNVDDSAFGLVAGVDEVLAGSAFMFSNLWLDDVLRRALNPSLPHMQNTDGEPLEFITVHFQLVSNSNSPAIRAALIRWFGCDWGVTSSSHQLMSVAKRGSRVLRFSSGAWRRVGRPGLGGPRGADGATAASRERSECDSDRHLSPPQQTRSRSSFER